MGADISTADSGTPPIQINPGSIKEDYVYEMPISSAQVKSAILLAAASNIADSVSYTHLTLPTILLV